MVVLVVEDDDDLRGMVAEALGVDGATVMTASDGAEALATLAITIVDVIVLDMLMPNMNGLEFLQRRAEDARTRDIPVIVFTGTTSIEHAGFGVDVTLHKPCSPEELLATFHRIGKQRPK